jgi:hypothetical protein
MPTLSFREYVSTRQTRYSQISAFLRGVIHDERFLAVNSREELDAYLVRRKIGPNGRMHAHAIWKSYLTAKKRHAFP